MFVTSAVMNMTRQLAIRTTAFRQELHLTNYQTAGHARFVEWEKNTLNRNSLKCEVWSLKL